MAQRLQKTFYDTEGNFRGSVDTNGVFGVHGLFDDCVAVPGLHSEHTRLVNGCVEPFSDDALQQIELSQAWQRLRIERNARLTASDWTQASDYASQHKAAWSVYRQALRDLPAKTEDPRNPLWPVPPTAAGTLEKR